MVNIEKVKLAIREAFPDNEIASPVDKGHWVNGWLLPIEVK